ncbi:hypothetical protein AB0K23_25150 [Streptomyces sp. NPDC049602]|uniref:hypothetical protein n=1 Tax=Streptomyces sp. NPDC049602 TaxID=3155504 RepID=UPI003428B30D
MGDHDTVKERLRAALCADDPWTALFAPNADRPGGLAEAVEELYRSDTDRASRPYLTWLLRTLGEPGDAVLLRLFAEPEFPAADRRDLLTTAVSRGLRLPAELLHAYAGQAPASGGEGARAGVAPAPELVDAMGLSGDPSFLPRLGALLGDPAAPRDRAALALGRLGAREWTEQIAGRLSEVTGLGHTAFVVALELMDDPAAVPHLLRWLAESGEERVYDVHHALVRLTGRDPLLPEGANRAAYGAAVRAAWADGRTERAPATVRNLVVESAALARFSVDGGAGRIRGDFDPPSPGGAWPRWDRSLTFDGKPLYGVGSLCDTCELGLTLLDWPDDEAARIAARMRGRLARLDRIDAALLAEFSPVLGELETGHYRALLLDLPLERVTEPARSWWFRRVAAGAEEDDVSEYAEGQPRGSLARRRALPARRARPRRPGAPHIRRRSALAAAGGARCGDRRPARGRDRGGGAARRRGPRLDRRPVRGGPARGAVADRRGAGRPPPARRLRGRRRAGPGAPARPRGHGRRR